MRTGIRLPLQPVPFARAIWQRDNVAFAATVVTRCSYARVVEFHEAACSWASVGGAGANSPACARNDRYVS